MSRQGSWPTPRRKKLRSRLGQKISGRSNKGKGQVRNKMKIRKMKRTIKREQKKIKIQKKMTRKEKKSR